MDGWAGEREGGGRGYGGTGGCRIEAGVENSLCYRLKFFTGKILIVAFY